MAKTRIVKAKRAKKGRCDKCGAPCTVIIEAADRLHPFPIPRYKYFKRTSKKI